LARKPANKSVPRGWRWKNGAWRYRVPRGMEHLWEGKREYKLGRTLAKAHKTWAERMEALESDRLRTVADLLDWYARVCVPEKAPATQDDNLRSIQWLRPVFGGMPVDAIQPHHAWQYAERRGAPVAAKHDIQVLRHAYTEAIQRLGVPQHNPLMGTVRLPSAKTGRERYVADWELLAVLKITPRRRSGSVLMCQAYARLKLLTGLRMTDMLLLREADATAEGLYVRPKKTAKTTGASGVYQWTDELRDAWHRALAARPVDISPWVFCNRRGQCYIQGGRPTGFESIWKRFIKRCVEDPDCPLQEPFAERDLRAKAATDAESIERARELLQQADERTTKRWYRRRPDNIQPLK